MVLVPAVNGWPADGVPEATVTPFTFMVAVASLVVGVMVTDEVALLTDVVYVVPVVLTRLEKGDSTMLVSLALPDCTLVTVIE
jgi:hypothetical protein